VSEFKNVTVVKKANIYFDGNVTSRSVFFEDGTKNARRHARRRNGDVRIAGDLDWKTVKEGDSSEVLASSSFKPKVSAFADYCCSCLSWALN